MSDAAKRFSLRGRIVCVTGASTGIGAHLARAFAEAGARVVAASRRAPDIDGAEPAGAIAPLSVDLADLTEIPAVAERIAGVFGPPDILVNAAGVNLRQPADAVTLEGWRQTIDLNLAAPFFLAQAFAPAMRAKGWGRIINFGSLQTERAFPAGLAYGASKGGVGQLTRAMAEAWSADGVTANALAPGFFPTELTGPVFADPERADANAAQTCVGRNGALEDLVGPALFFASPASDYVTGQVLFVDGGFTAK